MVIERCTACRTSTGSHPVFTHYCIDIQNKLTTEIFHRHCIEEAVCPNCNIQVKHSYKIHRKNLLFKFVAASLFESSLFFTSIRINQYQFALGFLPVLSSYSAILLTDNIEHYKYLTVAISTLAFMILSQTIECSPIMTCLGAFSAGCLGDPLIELYSTMNHKKVKSWPVYTTMTNTFAEALKMSTSTVAKIFFAVTTLCFLNTNQNI